MPDDLPKALEEFKKASEIKPEDDRPYRRISELYISINKFEESVVYLRKIISLDTKDKYAEWTLTRILIEHLSGYEEGLQRIADAEKLYGDDDLSFIRPLFKGKAYEGLLDYENAVKNYEIYLNKINSVDSADYQKIKKRVFDLKEKIQNSKRR